MLFLTYPATVEPGDEGGFVVSFRDVPEAVTEGDTVAEACANARDALGVALLQYPALGRAIPAPSRPLPVEYQIQPDPSDALKIAMLDAFRVSGLTKSELARRLGKGETEARRILDPMHPTKIGAINEALGVLGRQIVIGFNDETKKAKKAPRYHVLRKSGRWARRSHHQNRDDRRAHRA